MGPSRGSGEINFETTLRSYDSIINSKNQDRKPFNYIAFVDRK